MPTPRRAGIDPKLFRVVQRRVPAATRAGRIAPDPFEETPCTSSMVELSARVRVDTSVADADDQHRLNTGPVSPETYSV